MITNASLTLALAATSSLQRDLSKATDPLSYAISQAFADGTGLNAFNRVFSDTRTLASGANERLNMYSFGGAPVTDPVGQALTLSRVALLVIKNKNTTAGNKLVIGNDATSAAWISPFTANTDTIAIEPGGCLILLAPSAAGYVVANTTNHLLKILNAGSGSVDYDVVVFGSQ
jgi:hypothetical protein